jgi:hypothetical protein
MKTVVILSVVSIAALLGGCATIDSYTQMQATVSSFATSTHTTAAAETALMSAARSINVEQQFYVNANAYADGKAENIDLRAPYASTILTPEQLKTRQALLSAIVLYADKMQALACSDDDKTLDANSTAVAGKLKSAGSSSALTLSAGVQNDAAIAETALVTIADWAMDKRKYNDLRTAATQIQGSLQTVVQILERENGSLSDSINNDLGTINARMKYQIAKLARGGSPGGGPAAFFAMIQARMTFAGVTAMAPKGAADADATASVDFAQPVKDALDGVVKANEAIAAGRTVSGLSSLVSEISDHANAASAFYKGLTPKAG